MLVVISWMQGETQMQTGLQSLKTGSGKPWERV